MHIINDTELNELKRISRQLDIFGFLDAASDTRSIITVAMDAQRKMNEFEALTDLWKAAANEDLVTSKLKQLNEQYVKSKEVELFDPFTKLMELRGNLLSNTELTIVAEWWNKYPKILLKHAITVIEKEKPDKPFGLLKFLMTTYIENGFTTQADIDNYEKERQKSRKTQTQRKASEQRERIQNSIATNGSYKGIRQLDF